MKTRAAHEHSIQNVLDLLRCDLLQQLMVSSSTFVESAFPILSFYRMLCIEKTGSDGKSQEHFLHPNTIHIQ